MEISTKQKIIIFGAMALIFIASIIVKGFVAVPDEGNAGEIGSVIEEGVEGQAEEESNEAMAEAEEIIYIVDVEGAVVYPGVVKVEEGSRVFEAIEAAGGMLGNADSRSVNLAEVVEDGTAIYVPFEGEVDENGLLNTSNAASGLVNINKADRTELMTLPGIGEAYASSIIEYREKNGKFKTKDEIKNVSGIGDAKFAKLEDKICV